MRKTLGYRGYEIVTGMDDSLLYCATLQIDGVGIWRVCSAASVGHAIEGAKRCADGILSQMPGFSDDDDDDEEEDEGA